MKRCKWAMPEKVEKLNQIEICPKAMDLTCTLAKRIGVDGGGALIIDYGLNGVVSDSLQVSGDHELGSVRFMEVILDQAEVEDNTMIMNPEPSLKKNIGLYFLR
ncbi:hypothetical protein V6N13_043449 [Hibiscus sabdariffa]|uniref:Protein arginine methyltransferase NDUFAF7 n=1 Tax=Hibiscus sabdariffa TaxID=183260 RepID=A0ABR2G1K4_9ROSI